MKLRKKDMPLYGHCPAQDEFFLVVCKTCGHVIKPQALQKHIEQRHGGKIQCRARPPIAAKISPAAVSESFSQNDSSHSSLKHDIHGKTPPDHLRSIPERK